MDLSHRPSNTVAYCPKDNIYPAHKMLSMLKVDEWLHLEMDDDVVTVYCSKVGEINNDTLTVYFSDNDDTNTIRITIKPCDVDAFLQGVYDGDNYSMLLMKKAWKPEILKQIK